MALIECKECGNKVSTDAKLCPSCGAKMPKRLGLFSKIILGIFAISLIGALFGGKDTTKAASPSKQREKTQSQIDDDARFTIARATFKSVKSMLRDPDSLVVDTLLVNEKGTVTCMQYRAKNGFGGYNTETIVVAENSLQKATKQLIEKHCKTAIHDLKYVAD